MANADINLIRVEKADVENGKTEEQSLSWNIFRRAFPDKSLEKLYQLYSKNQKDDGLKCFLVASMLYDMYYLVVPCDLGELNWFIIISLLINSMLFFYCLLAFTKTSIAWKIIPHISWVLFVAQILVSLFFKTTDVTVRDNLGWVVVMDYLLYIMLPFSLTKSVLLSIAICTVYTVGLAVMASDGLHLIEELCVNVVLLLAVNVLGLTTFFLSDKQQRRAFLETRQSLEMKMLIEEQSAEQERLLLSVLPRHVAVRMRQDLGTAFDSQFKKIYMSRHENVSILYADIVGFTAISSTYSASELVKILNELFARFDKLSEKYKQLRIKILGDCYYCISGAPKERPDHAVLCVHMGLSMVKAIKYVQQTCNSPVDMRVGIHTGAVLAGVLGQTQWQFDVYSKDVELANKMESSGQPGRVHISDKTLSFLNGEFEVEPAYGERREEALRQAGIKTYFIVKVLKPFQPPLDSDSESEGTQSFDTDIFDDDNIPSTSAGHKSGARALTSVGTSVEPRPGTSAGTISEPRPGTSFEPRPGTSFEPRPGTSFEPRPGTSFEPRPGTSAETSFEIRPGTSFEPRPGTSAETSFEIRPGTSFEPRPGTSFEPRPGTSFEPRPGTSAETSFEIRPGTSFEPRPGTSAETSFEIRPGTSFEPRPGTSREYDVEYNDENNDFEIFEEESQQLNAPDEEAPEDIQYRLRKELIHKGGFGLLDDHTNFFSLSFNSKKKEKDFNRNKEATAIIAILGFPMILLFISLAQFIILPRDSLSIASFILGLIVLVLVSVTAIAELKPSAFPDIVVRCSQAANDMLWVRRTLAALATFILGCINAADIISCDSMTTTFPNCTIVGDIDSACVYPSYFSYFCVLVLLAASLPTQISYLLKIAIIFFIVAIHCTLNLFLIPNQLNCETSALKNTILMPNKYAVCSMLVCVAIALSFLARHVEKATRVLFLWKTEVEEQKEKARDMGSRNEALVYNILPPHVAAHFLGNRNRQHEELYSQSYAEVGILFASMPNFSDFYSEESVNNQGLECLRFLNEVISDFDAILQQPKFQDIIKIKTIGSTYMAASGLNPSKTAKPDDPLHVRWAHLALLVEFAFELKKALQSINEQSFNHFVLKMGINHGPITAGVIGARKPHYDIWGNSVNVASRMESTGKAGYIQVTEETCKILQHYGYIFEQRGLVAVKGKGQLMTYYLVGKRDTIPQLTVTPTIETYKQDEDEEEEEAKAEALPGPSSRATVLEHQF